jgi:FkbM family methyltransferase
MIKKILFIIYKFFYLFDKFLIKLINKSFLLIVKEFIEGDLYTSKIILNKKIKFFIPTLITKWRVDSFFIKEPETLKWIDSFINKKKIIFWDIGANIGLYSIYAALKHRDIKIYAIEPSTSNLRVLSRNISINNLEKKILITQLALSEKKTSHNLMMESAFIEGGALNTFSESTNFEGKKIIKENKYQVLGTNTDMLIKTLGIEMPNYIKIDVDGLEHLILKGSKQILKSKLTGILVEINENYTEQYKSVLKVMKLNNFKLIAKEQSSLIKHNKAFKNSYNYIFNR